MIKVVVMFRVAVFCVRNGHVHSRRVLCQKWTCSESACFVSEMDMFKVVVMFTVTVFCVRNVPVQSRRILCEMDVVCSN